MHTPNRTHPRRRPGMPRPIPDQWAEALKRQGFTDPRNGNASLRALGEATDLHASTLAKLVHGETPNPQPDTIIRIADALHLPPATVATWMGGTWEPTVEWVPPEEARYMNPQERATIGDLIKLMVKQRRG